MIPYEGEATNADIELFGSNVGSEMYIEVHTRPDIAYAVSVLSRFLSNPSPQHLKAADRILQYLKGTKYLGIVYGGGITDRRITQLHGYCDAGYASDKSQRKLVSGNAFFFVGGIVSHSSKRQTTVTLSTTKAEYYALAKAVAESLWLQMILRELMYKGPEIKKLLLYGDNQSSLNLVENPEFHQRTKHIDVKHHFIRGQVEKGSIELNYTPTDEMVADGLTKPLTAANNKKLVKLLRMESIQIT